MTDKLAGIAQLPERDRRLDRDAGASPAPRSTLSAAEQAALVDLAKADLLRGPAGWQHDRRPRSGSQLHASLTVAALARQKLARILHRSTAKARATITPAGRSALREVTDA